MELAVEAWEGGDNAAAGEVREGDVLSYDGGRGGTWTEASVVKVLTDNFPNLYFTIREAGMDGERRTVASCLRRNAEPPQLPPPLAGRSAA